MSPVTKNKDELRTFTPIGQLGQGFNEGIFWETVESGMLDAIIADGGSTDSGPEHLVVWLLIVPWSRLGRDLGTFAKAAHLHRVSFLTGSIGGDGENGHVDKAAEIIAATVRKNGYRPLTVIKIYVEISKGLVRQKLQVGLISPCGGGVPDLTEHNIVTSTRTVA